MTDPAFLLARDALLVLLVAAVFLLVFWRLTNTKLAFSFEAKTVEPEPAKADVKRLQGDVLEARSEALALREQLERRN